MSPEIRGEDCIELRNLQSIIMQDRLEGSNVNRAILNLPADEVSDVAEFR